MQSKGVRRVVALVVAALMGVTAVAVQPAAAQTSFHDVRGDEFYGQAAEWLLQQGLTTGYGGSHDQPSPFFAPMVTIDRAQLVTFLWRMAGSPGGHPADGFNDTADDAYYTEAVRWAKARGHTTGVGGTQAAPSPFFAPHDPVTRAQAFTLLWRYGGEPRWPKGTGPAQAYPQHQFDDTIEPSFYELALRWAKAEGLTTGYGGSHTNPSPIFVPDGHLTRGEMAAAIWRYAGNPAVDQPGNIEEGWWVEDDALPPPVEVTITSPTGADPVTVEQDDSFQVVFETNTAAGYTIELDDEEVDTGTSTVGTNTVTVNIADDFETGTYDLTVSVGTASDTETGAVIVVPPPIEFIGAETGDTSGSNAGSITIDVPDGVEEGDLLIAQIAVDQDRTVTSAGWDVLSTDNAGSGTGADGAFTQVILTRVADDAEPDDYTFTITGGNRRAVGGIVAYRNVDTAVDDGIEDHDADTGTNNTMVAPSVAGSDGGVLLAFFGQRNAEEGDEFTTPGDMDEIYLVWNADDRPQASANHEWLDADGATGTRTSESDISSSWVGASVTLMPLS